MKSGFVTIIGLANSGKSTLLNLLIGEKIAITSPRVQTTRDEIHGVYNDQEAQIVFIDTPGIHIPKHQLGERMNKISFAATHGADIIAYIVDGSRKKLDQNIIRALKNQKTPVFLLINKIDLISNGEILSTIDSFRKEYPFAEIIPLSALKGYNHDAVIKEIKKRLPEGPQYYPLDMKSNRDESFIVKELIRETALYLLQEELPHSLAVSIAKIEKREKLVAIDADIIVEKVGHRKIVLGHEGQMIKEIGIKSKRKIGDYYKQKIDLRLFVKVVGDWRNQEKYLKDYGYKYE